MSKTWYGHHIENIKGEDYVLFKDYLELDKEIERLNKALDEATKIINLKQKEIVRLSNNNRNAIEYIENHKIVNIEEMYSYVMCDELLNILKGSDSNEI